MAGRIVFTVGAVLRGDDAAGPMLAKMLTDDPVEGWKVIDGETVPENYTAVVKRERPDFLLLVDAAAMGLAPGEVRVLTRDDVAQTYMVSTHSMPLSFLIDEVQDSCGELLFLGIQPAQMDFYEPLTPAVMKAIEGIYQAIKDDDLSRYQPL